MAKLRAILLITITFIGFFFYGCADTTFDAFRLENRQNLLKLSIGMTKEQAIEIMEPGIYTVSHAKDAFATATLNNPYRSEILQGKEKTLEVIYYYTDNKRGNGNWEEFSIADDELTPLVFDENRLIGWGWGFLEQNVHKYEIRMR